ncbi:MAG: hypothetical protein V4484_19260 [Pseudomonadota bacterium]
MNVVGYPTPGKAKARQLLDAFCAGAGGMVTKRLEALQPGAAAFYGVVPATKPLWDAARAQGRDTFYMDNAYFDPTREVYFRVAKNSLQHSGLGVSDGKRFAALKIDIKPWRRAGRHVLICPQSDQFMRDVIEYPGSWLADTLASLRKLTDRELRVRAWTGHKREWFRTLPDDLRDCWALVTYSSASAVSAMLAGIPAICSPSDCISSSMAGRFDQIETPPMPDNRREWAEVVADNQWTLDEMRQGMTWRALNG